MHSRLQGHFQYVAQGVLLFTVILALVVTNWGKIIQKDLIYLFLFIPIHFYVLIWLTIRVDSFYLSATEYIFVIRTKVLKIANEPDMPILYLQQYTAPSSTLKLALLNGERYAFPMLTSIDSLELFIYYTVHYYEYDEDYFLQWYTLILLLLDSCCLLIFVGVAFFLGRRLISIVHGEK